VANIEGSIRGGSRAGEPSGLVETLKDIRPECAMESGLSFDRAFAVPAGRITLPAVVRFLTTRVRGLDNFPFRSVPLAIGAEPGQGLRCFHSTAASPN
jgi:hypothetical protein